MAGAHRPRRRLAAKHGEYKPPGGELRAARDLARTKFASGEWRARGAMTTQDSGARAVIARFSAPVLRPTRDSVRRLALASVIANAVLVCTGAAVRLSSTGPLAGTVIDSHGRRTTVPGDHRGYLPPNAVATYTRSRGYRPPPPRSGRGLSG